MASGTPCTGGRSCIETAPDGTLSVRQPTIFLDLIPVPQDQAGPAGRCGPPRRDRVEQALVEQALEPFLAEIAGQRRREVETVSRHLEISLNTIIDRVQNQFAELLAARDAGSQEAGIEGRLKQFEDRLDELNGRLERRRAELQGEAHCAIGDIRHHGRAWVLPHPDRDAPAIAPMVRDDDIERIAVQKAIEYEQARGWQVVSVEQEDRGFDLISRRPHPEDPQTAIEVRFIEVKGRASVGEVALSANKYKTAERLKKDYWLYVVYNCGTSPEIHTVQDPLAWTGRCLSQLNIIACRQAEL